MPRGGNNKISNRVMEHMVDCNMRVVDLAEKAGISVTHVSAIHSGRILPTVHTALKIARALRVSVEELWGGCVGEQSSER